MWNENAPLEILKGLPHDLSEENLSEIQNTIDWDKYVNSTIANMDLCGSYAPFCARCDKSLKYPCARAYVDMMVAEGMDVALKPDEGEAEQIHAEEAEDEVSVVSVTDEVTVSEAQSVDVAETVEEQAPVSEPVPAVKPVKSGKIRIAIAKKKV